MQIGNAGMYIWESLRRHVRLDMRIGEIRWDNGTIGVSGSSSFTLGFAQDVKARTIPNQEIRLRLWPRECEIMDMNISGFD